MSDPTAAPAISGVSHLDLSVSDADASAAWYERVLELSPSARVTLDERTMVVLLHPGTGLVIGLNQHHDRPGDGGRFDERRPGLDHVGLAVVHRHDLDVWEKRLTALGVTHSPVADTEHGAALVFRDPDHIQLELWWSKPTEPRRDQPGAVTGPAAGAKRATLVERHCPFSVAETVARLVAAAEYLGVTVFTTIDHAANARAAGLTMLETRVVIVGNPTVGTPAMLEAPDLALELPTRLLVRATPVESARSTVLFADPADLARRFGLSPSAASGLAGILALVDRVIAPGTPDSGEPDSGEPGSEEPS